MSLRQLTHLFYLKSGQVGEKASVSSSERL